MVFLTVTTNFYTRSSHCYCPLLYQSYSGMRIQLSHYLSHFSLVPWSNWTSHGRWTVPLICSEPGPLTSKWSFRNDPSILYEIPLIELYYPIFAGPSSQLNPCVWPSSRPAKAGTTTIMRSHGIIGHLNWAAHWTWQASSLTNWLTGASSMIANQHLTTWSRIV